MTDLGKSLSHYKLKPNSKVMMIYSNPASQTTPTTQESGSPSASPTLKKVKLSDDEQLTQLRLEVDKVLPKLHDLRALLDPNSANDTPLKKDLEFKARVVNELFLQILLKVDLIQDPQLRAKRKELVTYINTFLDEVDGLKGRISKL